ncbi:nitrate- and nitrite sensing domain-containing protein [Streptomyces sp. NBC_00059]|uniref:sensor histidine kinase n=1 Tax=Streptomyces sp. NBC_00059 TaxID=2975635 RepID=UPI00224F2FB2|nr:nitrate- and nitrite sensing domain-containing protein [Streptomyces sp. NBC_00059]MCX5416261.1 nitrate- and nitrite sensing domain-containing protein [Streptomyces sp. NBC_00059]
MRTPRTTTPDPGAHTGRPVTPPRGRRAHAGPPADERPDREAGPPTPEGNPTARGSLRPRTVRAKIISLLMVPVVSLLALWGFATVTTAQDVARLREVRRVDTTVRAPVAAAVSALQGERTAALRQSTSPGTGHAAALKQRAGRTDAALGELSLGDEHTVADAGLLPTKAAARLGTFLDQARELRTLRAGLLNPSEDGTATGSDAYARYTEAITAGFGVSGALTGIQDAETGSEARVLLELGRSGEMLAREEALLASAALTGTLAGEELRLFTGAVATRRSLAGTAAADLPPRSDRAWRNLTGRDAYRRLTAAEDSVLSAASGRRAAKAVSTAAWERDAAEVRTELRAIETDAGDRAADRAGAFMRALFSPAGAAVVLGFLAVAASLVISVRIGRALVVELVSLRDSALEIAWRKLPHAMQRLRTGEEIDVGAEAPAGRHSHDEIGQVGEALDTVHRAALDAAVERAELASGISGVFVNLARRSQVLVHRQLALLDGMERRAEDPGELGDLFRLDHLTTRMRRHAESLIILSGAAPGRAWRMPVPLTNVVRAAVSEIEDYARVEVRALPDAGVKGAAVADLTHLLAELVENAAQFSPPHTKVRISGEPVGNGYALEIEDRGLGMGQELLGEANRRIEQSETLDLFDSDRLGLFVVSRLSARHRIKVQLRTSAYGGTTAVVLLPTALLQNSLPEGEPAGRADDEAHSTTVARDDDSRTGPAGPRPTAFPAPVAVPALEPRTQAAPRPEPDAVPAPVTTLHRRARSTDDDGELPRRVRQASLVPQLRRQPAAEGQEPHGSGPAPTVERTPEQARDRMTAYRNGWVRGGGTAPGVSAPGRTARGSVSPFRQHSEGDQT